VNYRTENGPSQRIEDLLEVSGIGEATLKNINDFVTVSD
jgi:competence ComEA-like helix-hairpin-helix protein